MANGMRYLTLGFAALLVTIGVLKVAPIEPGHEFMVSLMNKFSTVTPLRFVGIRLSGTGFRALVGVLEIVFGSLLAYGRNDWPIVGGLFALSISAHGLFCQLALQDPLPDFVLPVVIFLLILLMLFGRNGLMSRQGKLHLS